MSDDRVPMTYVGSFYCGTPRALEPGNELFINYHFPKTMPPLDVFLDFGFLPQEFMHEQVSPEPSSETESCISGTGSLVYPLQQWNCR